MEWIFKFWLRSRDKLSESMSMMNPSAICTTLQQVIYVQDDHNIVQRKSQAKIHSFSMINILLGVAIISGKQNVAYFFLIPDGCNNWNELHFFHDELELLLNWHKLKFRKMSSVTTTNDLGKYNLTKVSSYSSPNVLTGIYLQLLQSFMNTITGGIES